MNERTIENLIIGAGPAGLAIAGRLSNKKIHFEVLEQSDKIANSWYHHYDRLQLHTVKELSHLPHLKFPDDYPRYVPKEKLTDYYQKYANQFNIRPHFNTTVTSVEKITDYWSVKTSNSISYKAKHVIIATGVNRTPYIPVWKGQQDYQGKIIHSRTYKNPHPFIGQKVLVIGMGNTGAELALDLSEHGIDVTISVRSPIIVVPRDINGRPVQTTAKKLEKLPFGLGKWIGKKVRQIIIGDLTSFGIPMSKEDPVGHLRRTGKTPVIDLGTIQHIKEGKIKVIPEIDRFYEKGVVIKNGECLVFDSIILATGYRAKIEELLKESDGLLDVNGVPKHSIPDGQYKGLFFIGFDNYKLGGILGTIYSDSALIADVISKNYFDPR